MSDPATPDASDDRASILLVDDRAENLRALEAVLEPLGQRVVSVTSGRDALRALLTERFAVILLDVQMPEMDGFETAKYIREREKTRSIPIIFLTAISTGSDHVFRGYEVGAVDYIIKPFDPVVLRSKVSVFVELYRQARQIEQQAELLRIRELEREAHRAAARRHRRSRFLAAATTALEERFDFSGRLEQLVRVCVPELADFATVELVRRDGQLQLAAVAHRDEEIEDELRVLVKEGVHGSRAGTAIAELGKSRLEAHVVNELRSEFAYGGDEGVGSLVPTSFIGTPLTIGGTSAGVLALGMAGAARQLGQEELELAEELADRASMALENARLYELERETSRALQLSLLASRPIQTSLVTAAMRYVPATEELDVGGDWYDAIERPDGAIVIAAGDVVGRGLKAATTMGKLRSALGALALVVDDAGGMLDRLDSFAEQVEGAHFATVACVLIEPTGRIHYSLAGHPPPLLIRPDGEAAYLEGGRGLPLGVIGLAPMRRSEALEEMPAGSTLILYTDGLIERSGISLDEGLKRLERAAVARAQLEAEVLCDELIAELTASARDDVAIVCLRFEPADTEIFSRRFVTAPAELGPMRAALREWLAGRVKSSQELNDIVLACAEACSNAVQHAYERHDGEAALELRVTRDRALVARVRDFGRWREQPASSLAGRGLHIMRGLMDQVHVHVNAGGTTVVMQKQLLTEPTPDRLESASASSG